MLDISRPTVYSFIYQGKLEALNIGKRCLRITEESITGLLTESKVLPFDMGILLDVNKLNAGDLIVVNPDSVEFNELAGLEMVIVRVTNTGVFAKEPLQKGSGVFLPFREITVKADVTCELHGGA
jgi:hypothetical protein